MTAVMQLPTRLCSGSNGTVYHGLRPAVRQVVQICAAVTFDARLRATQPARTRHLATYIRQRNLQNACPPNACAAMPRLFPRSNMILRKLRTMPEVRGDENGRGAPSPRCAFPEYEYQQVRCSLTFRASRQQNLHFHSAQVSAKKPK